LHSVKQRSLKTGVSSAYPGFRTALASTYNFQPEIKNTPEVLTSRGAGDGIV